MEELPDVIRGVVIAVRASLSIACFVFATVFLYKLHKHAKQSNEAMWNPVSIMAITIFVLWCIAFSIAAIFTSFPFSEIVFHVLYVAFAIFYTAGFVSSYIFMVTMQYQSFVDSQFASSRKSLIFHGCITLLLLCLCGTGTIFYYVLSWFAASVITFFNVLCYLLGLCMLIHSTNSKLLKLVGKHLQPQDRASPAQHSADFLKTATRLGVLVSVVTISTVSYILVVVIRLLVGSTLLMVAMDWISYGLSTLIGCTCLYLLFAFNTTEYRIACKCCNYACFTCCVSLALKRGKSTGTEKKVLEIMQLDLVLESTRVESANYVSTLSETRKKAGNEDTETAEPAAETQLGKRSCIQK